MAVQNRLPRSHNDILRLVRGSAPSSSVLPSKPPDSNEHIASYYWSEVIVSSLRRRLILYCQGQLFCFDAFLSACGQTRRMGMVRQGSSLTWLSIRIGLQGRKPRESNKLFDLFFPPWGNFVQSVQSVQSVVEKESILWRTALQAAVSYRGLSWHTSSVGVPGYSWYCPPGSRVLCDAS